MDEFYLALLLYIGAIGLAFVDILVPSGGLLLIMAAVAAVASILFGFRSSQTMGMTMLTLVTASIPVFTIVAIRIWPYTPIGRRIILRASRDDTDGQQGSSKRAEDPLIGQVFKADSALMPSGQIKVGRRRVNAVAETGLIEAGSRVLVVDFRDRNYVVRPTDQALTAQATTTPPTDQRPLAGQASRQPNPDDSAENLPDDAALLEQPMDQLGLDSIDDETLDQQFLNDDSDLSESNDQAGRRNEPN